MTRGILNRDDIQETELGVERRCAKCREWWPLDHEFYDYYHKGFRGFVNVCRACRALRRRELAQQKMAA